MNYWQTLFFIVGVWFTASVVVALCWLGVLTLSERRQQRLERHTGAYPFDWDE